MENDLLTNTGHTTGIAGAEQVVLRFPQGLPGFEEMTRFLLYDQEGLQPLTLLVALDAANVALPLLRSAECLIDYSPSIPVSDLNALEATSVEELEIFVVVMFEAKGEDVAVNLRAPICINRTRRLGRQVVLSDGTLPLQYPLVQIHE